MTGNCAGWVGYGFLKSVSTFLWIRLKINDDEGSHR